MKTVSLYRNGPFTDLCRGPHAPSTGRIKAFKLLSLAGAYWRGDEHNKMLTRIYGTAFLSKKDLEQHLEMLEQARARDHRRLGPALGLFMLREESPGMPFYLPNGVTVVNEIERVVREQLLRARLPGDPHAAHPRRGAVEALRATGTTTARTCSSRSPARARAGASSRSSR